MFKSSAAASPSPSSPSAAAAASPSEKQWDPLAIGDSAGPPNRSCVTRIQRDLQELGTSPLPGVLVVPSEKDVTLLHVLITGPSETPYEGGFFYFLLKCPPDYPARPPYCRIMTTDQGQVRFNPNLYANGKVCLSILGTWAGPAWTPSQTLASVVLSIQSLMSSNPYFNEPGFEVERHLGASKRYNAVIRYETLRVAVCGMLRNQACVVPLPPVVLEFVKSCFYSQLDFYRGVVEAHLSQDKQQMFDPFLRRSNPVFQWKAVAASLEELAEELKDYQEEDDDTESDDDEEDDDAEEEDDS